MTNFLNSISDGHAGMILKELPDGKTKGSFRTTRDDVVVAKVHEWTDSEVIPYPGDVIEFGPFKDPKDVNRLLCRVGGEPSIDLQPVELWDGRYVGRVTCEGGPNIIAAPQRVKVSSGQPLSVPIKKIRTY